MSAYHHVKTSQLVGHDWGARAAGNACSLDADAASHLVLLSVGYGTSSPDQPVPLSQARNYWTTGSWPRPGRGHRPDSRREFTRYMWDTWSPAGWYEEADFEKPPAPSTIRTGRRWCCTPIASAGATPRATRPMPKMPRLTPAPVLAVPTLVLHGGPTPATRPPRPRGKDAYFSGRYQRRVLDGVAISATRGAAGGGPGHPEILRTGLKPGAGSVRTRLVSRPAPLHAPE